MKTSVNLAGVELKNPVMTASGTFGSGAEYSEFVDMFKSGIVDPTKVTRSALQNAASISASFLTAEAAVVEIEKPQAVQAPSDMGGMGMM